MPCLGPEGEGGRDFKLEESEEAIKPLPHNDATKKQRTHGRSRDHVLLTLRVPKGCVLAVRL